MTIADLETKTSLFNQYQNIKNDIEAIKIAINNFLTKKTLLQANAAFNDFASIEEIQFVDNCVDLCNYILANFPVLNNINTNTKRTMFLYSVFSIGKNVLDDIRALEQKISESKLDQNLINSLDNQEIARIRKIENWLNNKVKPLPNFNNLD